MCFSLKYNHYFTQLFFVYGISCVSINYVLPFTTGAFHVHIYAPIGRLASSSTLLSFISFIFMTYFSSLRPFTILFIPQAAPDVVDEVKRGIEAVKSKISENTVNQALQKLRQLLSHPPGVFDVHSAMAALERLSDIARENGEEHAPRYNAILKQAIQRILLKLLATKEEIAKAKEIEKATKSNPLSPPLFSSQVFNGQRPPARARRYVITCYACGLRGHIPAIAEPQGGVTPTDTRFCNHVACTHSLN